LTGKYTSWVLVKRFIGEVAKYKRLLVVTVLTIIASSIATMLSPYILRLVIDEYIVKGRLSELPFIATLYLVTLIAQWGFTTARTYLIELIGQKVLFDIRNALFNKLLRVKINYYKDKQIGDLVSRIINDTSVINEVFVSGVLNVIGDLFSVIGIFIIMLILSPSLTLVAMISVPIMIAIAWFFGGRLRRAYKDTREKIARISSVVSESIAGIETVKAFGRESMVLREFDNVSRETLRSFIRVAVLMGLFWPLMNLSSTLSIILLIMYGGYLYINGSISLGVLIAFIQYVQRFNQPINNIVSMYDQLQSAIASLERLYEVLDVECVEEYSGVKVEGFKGRVVFENVWFEYEKGNPVLKNINLTINPGEIVAIVGHTGAGKTTLASLLLRFYDDYRGRILIDDIDIKNVNLACLRSRVIYVPQETYLFPGTIMDNIKIGLKTPDEKVIEVCKYLGIHDFIEKLPNGYYTDAGEAGRKLSMGEKQLISIARAMLRNPDIIILDEALSSVDPKTEEIIRKAIRRLMEGRTGIIIAHRLTIVHDVDRIIMLENGEIVEEGSLDELLKIKGRFYEYYVSQLGERIVVKAEVKLDK